MSKSNFIQYGKKKIYFEIKRSGRRETVGIQIDPKAGVIVRSSQFLKLSEIQEIVRKRARWIIEKQNFIKNNSHLNPTKEFVSGEAFSYLGRQYRLKVLKTQSEKDGTCKLINGRLMVAIDMNMNRKRSKSAVKNALSSWYLVRAEEKIPERVNLYARRIGKWPERIEIKNHKRRWGSCSQNGTVRFNWKIIMTPVTILDYVIVHELCHLIHENHNTQFWRKVETILPDYTIRRNKLKEYSFQIKHFD